MDYFLYILKLYSFSFLLADRLVNNNKDNNIHHKDSIEIDKYCLKNGYGNPMLIAHESILEAERIKLNKYEDASNTLINIGAKIGRLMETTQKAIEDES